MSESPFKLVGTEIKDLTPELVEWFCSLEASPTERPFDERRIRHLRMKADEGLLVPFGWAIAKLNGKTYRMNGQHSSSMLAALDGQLPAGLKVHLDTFAVESKHGLAALFRQFDDRRSGRTSADVAGAYQGLEESLREVPRPIAKLAMEGIGWYNRQVEGFPVPAGDSLYDWFSKPALHSFIRWSADVLGIKTPEMKKVPVVAAMYGTFIKAEPEAQSFWAAVARGDDLDENAPSAKLDDWLRSLIEERKKNIPLKPTFIFQGCVFAWNAYREGKAITTIKADTKKGLLAIHD